MHIRLSISMVNKKNRQANLIKSKPTAIHGYPDEQQLVCDLLVLINTRQLIFFLYQSTRHIRIGIGIAH